MYYLRKTLIDIHLYILSHPAIEIKDQNKIISFYFCTNRQDQLNILTKESNESNPYPYVYCRYNNSSE